jgi:hypothetical protein
MSRRHSQHWWPWGLGVSVEKVGGCRIYIQWQNRPDSYMGGLWLLTCVFSQINHSNVQFYSIINAGQLQWHHSSNDATTDDATRLTMQLLTKRAVARRGVGTSIYPRLSHSRDDERPMQRPNYWRCNNQTTDDATTDNEMGSGKKRLLSLIAIVITNHSNY